MRQRVGVCILATIALALPMGVRAHDGHPKKTKESDTTQKTGRENDVAQGKRKEGESSVLANLWARVQSQKTELERVIRAKQLKQVHHLAFAISDLVKTMPGKSTMLSSANMDKLESYVDEVVDVADELDEAGDGGDQTAANRGWRKLDTALKALEALYPKNVLGTSSLVGTQGTASSRAEWEGYGIRAERVGNRRLRLTWRQGEVQDRVERIVFFLADRSKRSLDSKEMDAEPFTATFDLASDVAYMGLTVTYDDGVESTTLVPYTVVRPDEAPRGNGQRPRSTDSERRRQ